ncbi:MAG TPA: PAS domain S-box protein [Anaerolineae bacterium]|nr:PAS domain S-box protein [Anaerolineae bacterium]
MRHTSDPGEDRLTAADGADGSTIDISEEPAVGAALPQNPSSLELFVKYTPAAVAMFDRDMRYMLVSHRWLTDYNLGARDIIGLSHYEVFPDLPERWKEVHRRCLAGAVARCKDDPFLRANGTLDWVSWEVRPWRDATGAIGGLIIFSEVITERKQAEQALRESESKYRQLVEQASDAISITDVHGNYLEVNTAASELLGYRRDELLQMNAADLIPAEDLAASPLHFERLRTEKAVLTERRLRRKDGTLITVETNARRLEDGRMQAITRDITARKRAEAALRETENRLRMVVTRAPIILWAIDREGNVTLLAGRALDGLGIQPEEIIGSSVLDRLSDAVPGMRAWFQTALSGSEAIAIGKIGEVVLETWYSPLRDSNGEISGIIGVSTDITERARAEEALRQAQKMESLGILAGGVAHDFNNLLASVLGQASVALAKLPLEHIARTHVEKAVKATQHAADLTRQLLAYSGRGQFKLQPIHFNALIEENLHLFEVAVPKQVELRSALAEPLPWVEGDVAQMQQVIMNLILNAAEAIGEQPGRVTVTTGVQDVDSGDSQLWRVSGVPLTPGRYVTLEVRDDGCGMDAATLSRIFDPFFTTKFTGRGLGLAAVLGIVRGHKGGLTVTSEVGTGSAFKLLFPAGALEPSTPVGSPSEYRASGARSWVLIIDDEEPVREAITDILELDDLQALTAANGAAGIALYRAHQAEIRLVLLDLSMPGLSGEETFRELRQIDPDVPVLLSSGYSQTEATQRFASEALAGFIQKPYDANTLLIEIRRHLR